MTVADTNALKNALRNVMSVQGSFHTILKPCSCNAPVRQKILDTLERVLVDLNSMADREKRRQVRREVRRLRLKIEGMEA
jgi:hypothetical protein